MLSVLAMLAVLGTSEGARGYVPLKLEPVGHSFGPLRSDGGRWAAYSPSRGTTMLIDAHTGRSTERADPAGCASVYSPIPDGGAENGGGLVAVGGGELLYECLAAGCGRPHAYSCRSPDERTSYVRYVVEDAASGREHEITRLPAEVHDATPSLDSIGSQWSEGNAYEYKHDFRFFVNWRTGQTQESGETETNALDLSSASLWRSLCRPVLRRTLEEFEERLPEALYAPPFAVEQVSGTEGSVSMLLRRCGTLRSERLPDFAERPLTPQLGGGVFSWIASRKNQSAAMFVTRVRRSRHRWHGPIYLLFGPKYGQTVGAPRRGGWTLQHTATTVYQSNRLVEPIRPGVEDEGRSVIYAARVP